MVYWLNICPDYIKTTTTKVISTGIAIANIDGVIVRSKNSASSTYLGNLRTGDKVKIIEKISRGNRCINNIKC